MYVSTPKKTSFSVILHLLLYEFYSINLGFSSVSLVCQPMSKNVHYRQISLCRLVAGLLGWMDGSGYLVGWLRGNAWLAGCLGEG